MCPNFMKVQKSYVLVFSIVLTNIKSEVVEQSNGYKVPYMIRDVNDHARARQAVSRNSITE